MGEYIVGGVPRSLVIDGWWLHATVEDYAIPPGEPPDDATGAIRGPWRGRLIAVVALVMAADILFWSDQTPGLSIAVFALAVALVVRLLSGRAVSLTVDLIAVALLVAALLPVIEMVQPLSLAFCATGVLGYAVWAMLGHGQPLAMLAAAAVRLAVLLPWLGAADGLGAARAAVHGGRSSALGAGLVRGWAMPVVMGGLFASLLMQANPILDNWARALVGFDWGAADAIERITFWGFVGMVVWPFVATQRVAGLIARPFRPLLSGAATPTGEHMGINPASIANALFAFNALFAVQTVLDAVYLWSGADLPVGLTYADYAHRGAYPLVVTALLAGAFAIVSRPHVEHRPLLRLLLAIWIVQNVLLVLSSLYRLDLYVDVYGLTYLRVRAAIWMALVPVGLVLLVWQLWRHKTNGWLLSRNAAVLGATLYACAFINFAELIAGWNLERHTKPAMGHFDGPYLCSLGPFAAAAILRHEQETGEWLCGDFTNLAPPVIEGWRDWGFRKWRVRRYVAGISSGQVSEASGEDPNRR